MNTNDRLHCGNKRNGGRCTKTQAWGQSKMPVSHITLTNHIIVLYEYTENYGNYSEEMFSAGSESRLFGMKALNVCLTKPKAPPHIYDME